MTNSEYWKKRAEERKNHVSRTADEAAEEARESFERAKHRINREVAYWIQKFADAEGISYDEARKMLEAGELEQFRMTLGEYIARGKALDVDPEWQDAMVKASALHHIDRLNALKAIIRAELEENKARLKRSQWMHDIADYSYEHTLFGIETGLEMQIRFRQPDLDRLHRDIEEAWAPDGIDFVDRVGINNDKLAAEVDRLLTQGMITGETYEELAKQLTDQFALKEYEAARIIRTEATRVASMSEAAAYRTAGLEEYEILVTLDERTCNICGPMDGHVERVDDMEPGVTAPPFHPNCRCTTIGHYEDGLIDETRIARDEDGNPIHVNVDMTWEEWRRMHSREGTHSLRMKTETEWEGKPRQNAKEELLELKQFALDKGIVLDPMFEHFDGDISLVKDFIGTVNDNTKDKSFMRKKKIKLSVNYTMPDDTYAQTGGSIITINGFAYRDRELLKKAYRKKVEEGWFPKGSSYYDVATHESCHLIVYMDQLRTKDASSVFGNNVVETTKNIRKRISEYALYNNRELIAEAYVAYKTGSRDEYVLKVLEYAGII